MPIFRTSLFFLGISILALTSCKVNEVQSDSKPVTHEIWDSLLQEHVNEQGWVDYSGFVQDSNRLNQYLDILNESHPNEKHWSREERLAYWINAYNAYTVKLIVDHYPTKSIRDIKNGIPFVNSVWDIKFIEIEGQKYDLNNIEHGIIRSRFDEPRIHFAVNCASISCPNLANYAYTPEKLDAQLTQAAKAFITDESKNKLSKDKVQLSKIFSWYRGDFKEDGKNIIDYINQYAPIEIEKRAKIEYLDYNWGVNGQ
ncbi:MAG: DUF547 domain-containing protein [Chitinophagales bacterium]|nr:DUF547 domain-containing protein [Chitinophagales bacterium]